MHVASSRRILASSPPAAWYRASKVLHIRRNPSYPKAQTAYSRARSALLAQRVLPPMVSTAERRQPPEPLLRSGQWEQSSDSSCMLEPLSQNERASQVARSLR